MVEKCLNDHLLLPGSEHPRVKLVNNPFVFMLEDGDFTLEGCLFAAFIPFTQLTEGTSVEVKGSRGQAGSTLVDDWNEGDIIIVPGGHLISYAGKAGKRCCFLFLPYEMN